MSTKQKNKDGIEIVVGQVWKGCTEKIGWRRKVVAVGTAKDWFILETINEGYTGKPHVQVARWNSIMFHTLVSCPVLGDMSDYRIVTREEMEKHPMMVFNAWYWNAGFVAWCKKLFDPREIWNRDLLYRVPKDFVFSDPLNVNKHFTATELFGKDLMSHVKGLDPVFFKGVPQPWEPLPAGYRLVTKEEKFKYMKPADVQQFKNRKWEVDRIPGWTIAPDVKYAVREGVTLTPVYSEGHYFPSGWPGGGSIRLGDKEARVGQVWKKDGNPLTPWVTYHDLEVTEIVDNKTVRVKILGSVLCPNAQMKMSVEKLFAERQLLSDKPADKLSDKTPPDRLEFELNWNGGYPGFTFKGIVTPTCNEWTGFSKSSSFYTRLGFKYEHTALSSQPINTGSKQRATHIVFMREDLWR